MRITMRLTAGIVTCLMIAVLALTGAAKEAPDDGAIEDQVRIRLAGDRDVKGTTLEVEVSNGVVTLRGQVDSDKARKRAEKLAKKVKGVERVINELTIPPE